MGMCFLYTATGRLHTPVPAAALTPHDLRAHLLVPTTLSSITGKRFAVGMCSLEGHQLAGEERFQVEMLPDGSVWWVSAALQSNPPQPKALIHRA
jgi:hypothetical protein